MSHCNVSNAAGLDAFKDLLRKAKLPVDDLDEQKQLLIGFYKNEELIGTGGLEIFGSCALLRSIAVRQDFQGKSVGSVITEKMLQEARQRNIKDVYLLTETTYAYFQRKGFADTDRGALPVAIKQSYQFQSACPASAKVMHLKM
jgi:N-acetylglutamate synthase-like GNAT family acetyltransferase